MEASELISALVILSNPKESQRIKDMLAQAEDHRFRVETESLPSKGQDRLGQEQFDVVLLDLSLPDGKGLEALKQIHSMNMEVPVVALISSEEKVAPRAMADMVSGYVVRESMNTNVLELALANAVGNKRDKAVAYEDRRFKALVDKSKDGILTIGSDGKVAYASPSFTNLFSETGGGLETWAKSIHPDDMATVADLLTQISDKPGSAVSCELRAQDKEGMWHYLEATGTNYLKDEAVGSIVVNVHDVTEKRKADEALKLKEESYRRLIEKSPTGIAIVDAQGALVYKSPSLTQMLGHDEQDDLGTSVFDWMHPDDIANAMAALGAVMASPGASGMVEMRVKHKDGRWRWMEIVGTNHLEDPAVKGIVVNMRDITERKQNAEVIEERERRFKQLLEGVNEAIAFLDATGNIIDVNDTIQQILGLSRDEVIGRNFLELGVLSEEDIAKYTETFVEVVTAQKARLPEAELQIVHKDGHRIWIQASGHMLQGPKGEFEGILYMAKDITERKKKDEELRESQEQYRLLGETITDLVFVVSLHPQDGFRVKWRSPSLKRATGFTDEESASHTAAQIMPPASVATSFKVLMEELEIEAKGEGGPGRSRVSDMELYRKDGTVIPVEVHTTFIRDAQGKPEAILGVARDITDRRRIEAETKRHADELAEQNAKLEAAKRELEDLNRRLMRQVEMAGQKGKS